jgi:hypothetical protein
LTWLYLVVFALAFLAARPAVGQPAGSRPAAGAAGIEGRVVAMPADNLLLTDIQVSRVRAARILEGEVVDVELGGSRVRARFVGPSDLERLLKSPEAWAAADVDALCFENDDRTLAITAAGAPLADLIQSSGQRRVVVSKP